MYFNLLKKSFKINSSYRNFNSVSISGYLINRIANFFIPIFLILKIKANTVTMINFFVGFTCIIFFFIFNGDFFSYSILLYIINKILDHCDGGLARFYKNKTFFGKFIDSISDVLFLSFFNLSLAIFFYLKTNNFYLLIYGSISSIFICFDVFILDKFSSLVRWCNKENKKSFPTYIRKNNNPRLFYTFEDLIFLCVIIIYFFKSDLVLTQKVLFIIFSVYSISSLLNIYRHTILGYQFLNYNKK